MEFSWITRIALYYKPMRNSFCFRLARSSVAGIAVLLSLATCATVSGDVIPAAPPAPPADASYAAGPTETTADSQGSVTATQQRIVTAAQEMLESQNFVVGERRFSYDCTGTILAIYAMAGIHVVDLFPQYTGNGVNRLYSIARDQDLLYHTLEPVAGDLIFWDNTYDKNGDKAWNDGLTHVGLVLSVDTDGTIEYVHHHYTQGVVIARMNLRNPRTHLGEDGVIVNSPMRMRSHRYLNPDEWLASHLYRELGALYKSEHLPASPVGIP